MLELLRARGWWAGLVDLDPTGQTEAIRETKAMQSWAMFETVIAEATHLGHNDPHLGEATALVALEVVEALRRRRLDSEIGSDLEGETWTVIANCRRIASDWNGANAALTVAKNLLERGTRDPQLKARLLSVQASLATDAGKIDAARELLNRAKTLYQSVEDWDGVAWIALQQANALQELHPEEALEMAREVLRLSGSSDIRIEMFAKSVATHCLLSLGRTAEAMRNFHETRHLYEQFPETSMRLRVGYLEARLLGALKCVREADKLFRAVAEGCWDCELYKDSFVVRLAWFEFHFKRGAFERAAGICREAVRVLEELDRTHEQMLAVWRELLARVQERLLDASVLQPLREYVLRHWFAPAEQVPSLRVEDPQGSVEEET